MPKAAQLKIPNKSAAILLTTLFLLPLVIVAIALGAAVHSIVGVLLGTAAAGCALPLFRFIAERSFNCYAVRPAEGGHPPTFSGRTRVGFVNLPLFPDVDLKQYPNIAMEEGSTAAESAGNFLTYLLVVVLTGGCALPIIFLFGLQPGGNAAMMHFAEAGVEPDFLSSGASVRFPDNESLRKIGKFLRRNTDLNIERL